MVEETTTEKEETNVSIENETTGGDGAERTSETEVNVEKTVEESTGSDEKPKESDVNVSIDQTIHTPGDAPAADPNKNTEAAQEPVDPII